MTRGRAAAVTLLLAPVVVLGACRAAPDAGEQDAPVASMTTPAEPVATLAARVTTGR